MPTTAPTTAPTAHTGMASTESKRKRNACRAEPDDDDDGIKAEQLFGQIKHNSHTSLFFVPSLVPLIKDKKQSEYHGTPAAHTRLDLTRPDKF